MRSSLRLVIVSAMIKTVVLVVAAISIFAAIFGFSTIFATAIFCLLILLVFHLFSPFFFSESKRFFKFDLLSYTLKG